MASGPGDAAAVDEEEEEGGAADDATAENVLLRHRLKAAVYVGVKRLCEQEGPCGPAPWLPRDARPAIGCPSGYAVRLTRHRAIDRAKRRRSVSASRRTLSRR